jgi:hypothetical protein
MKVPKVRDVAKLTSKTDLTEAERYKLKLERTPPRTLGDLQKIQVDIRVWKKAKQLAKGDVSRIVVRSSQEVVVVNNPTKRRKQ